MTIRVHHLAVIVAAVAYFVWGAVWFGVLHGPWAAATGRTPADMQPIMHVVSFLAGLAMSYAVGVALQDSARPSTLRHGVEFGVFMGVALWMTNLLILTTYEGRPVGLWLIDGFYVVIGLAIVGAIVGGWRKRA